MMGFAAGDLVMEEMKDRKEMMELLVDTKELLENLEMRPDHPNFAGFAVHIALLERIEKFLDGV